jgi:hypothetical protein
MITNLKIHRTLRLETGLGARLRQLRVTRSRAICFDLLPLEAGEGAPSTTSRHSVSVDLVTLGGASGSISFASAHRDAQGYVDLLDVTASGPSLRAGLTVYAGLESGFDLLARYFEDLEGSFAGWEGERVFESIEGDLRLVAIHDGRVRLQVRLWQYVVHNCWKAETTVVLQAGEELSQAVRDLAALLRSEEHRVS